MSSWVSSWMPSWMSSWMSCGGGGRPNLMLAQVLGPWTFWTFWTWPGTWTGTWPGTLPGPSLGPRPGPELDNIIYPTSNEFLLSLCLALGLNDQTKIHKTIHFLKQFKNQWWQSFCSHYYPSYLVNPREILRVWLLRLSVPDLSSASAPAYWSAECGDRT